MQGQASMNVIKGIDRIALILALLAMILAFFVGIVAYRYEKTGVIVGLSDEFRLFIKQEYGKEINQDEFCSFIKAYGGKGEELSDCIIYTMLFIRWQPYLLADPPDSKNSPASVFRSKHSGVPTYKYEPAPQVWELLAVGLVCAALSFVVILFGIRLISRGIKHFSLWIIDGFRG